MKEKIQPEYVRENIKREIKNFVNKILEREDFEEIWQEIIEFCDDLKKIEEKII
jgi:Na+/phosphate symporter